MNIQRIPLESLHNTRDLTGMETLGGRRIRPCRLIRSGELCGASPCDLAQLKNNYALSRIVDFRTEAEQKAEPDPEVNGVQLISNPLLSNSAIGITREEEDFAPLFRKMHKEDFFTRDYMMALYRNLIILPEALAGYRRFFDILLSAENGATLWHCSAGKDRVGVGTMMLLTALGVKREVIMRDYMATNDFSMATVRRQIEHMMPSEENEHLHNNLFVLFTANPCFLESVYTEMETQSGGAFAFLQEKLFLKDEEVSRLCELYLE